MNDDAPGQNGYRMPAEWEPHRATWIAWPHEKSDWPGRFTPIPWTYTEIVRVLSRYETVAILVADAAMERRARVMLRRAGAGLDRIEFHHVATDRTWTRDSGPIFVVNSRGERLATQWRFNAWSKYPNYEHDARVPAKVSALAGVPGHRVQWEGRDIVMEGGAIDVDGEGTLLCTEECLLSEVQARNPGLDRRAMESIFRDSLGIRRVVWLGAGIVGDDTHGHIDDVARFVAPGKILLCEETNPRDENHAILRDNLERLRSEDLEIISLPMPAPLHFAGQRLPASFANFYIANGVVLVPTFNDPGDRRALGILADCFPGCEIIGIHCVELIWGLGTLHCATQQEPR